MAEESAPRPFPFPPGSTIYHPSPLYAELRQERPVTPITTPDGKSAFLVTRYSDVRRVLTDPRFSRAAAARSDVPLTGLGRLSAESLLALDPPEHTRLRKLISRAMTPRLVEQLRPGVAALVDELFRAMTAKPKPVDFMADFSLRLPIQVICKLLGVPVADRHILHAWSDTVMGDWQSNPADLNRVVDDFSKYFADLFSVKRADPADDLITALLAACDDRGSLSHAELTNLCIGLFVAGHETTVAELNMFLLTLLHHPKELARLRDDPELVPQAVDELLRFAQISPAGGTLPRATTEEVELGGVRLPAGSVVMTATTSANRDPEQFPEPDRLDLCRADNAHLAFGAGPHYCLGVPLVRMQLQEALRGLLRHMPDVRVVVPDAELRFKRGMMIRSVESLPVTW